MTTIIIGRDTKTSKLRMTANGKSATISGKENVPMGVGREHISITIDDEGSIVLQNLNIENDTYVNGIGVETKRLKNGDRIELGKDHYRIGWDVLQPFIPKYADIRPLKDVWEEYQNKVLQMQIMERRSGVLRSATGLITMAAMVLGVFTGRDNPMYLTLYIIAGVVSAAFFVKAYLNSSKMPKMQQELRDSLPKKYVCPSCGHFMGNQSYEILSQGKACPYCKAIYRK